MIGYIGNLNELEMIFLLGPYTFKCTCLMSMFALWLICLLPTILLLGRTMLMNRRTPAKQWVGRGGGVGWGWGVGGLRTSHVQGTTLHPCLGILGMQCWGVLSTCNAKQRSANIKHKMCL